MTHTPGPWHTDPTKSFYVFADGSLAEQAGVTNGPFVANASTLANARLIAAAPDLLAALQLITDGCTRVIGQDSCGHDMVKVRHAAIERARAAIARATG